MLNYLKSWSNVNDTTPLRGVRCESDTAKVVVPIRLIKLANIKLIERNYLMKINIEKDSIIDLKDKYIVEQGNVIAELQDKLVGKSKDINTLQKDLYAERKKSKLLGKTTVGSIGIIIVLLLIL